MHSPLPQWHMYTDAQARAVVGPSKVIKAGSVAALASTPDAYVQWKGKVQLPPGNTPAIWMVTLTGLRANANPQTDGLGTRCVGC